MKRTLSVSLLFVMMNILPAFTACSPDEGPAAPGVSHPVPSPEPVPDPEPGPSESIRIGVAIGTAVFTATLSDNPGARAFAERLPMTVRMDELNGNEKYHYLSPGLPTAASNPGNIHTGDLMLFGSDCLVLFYQTFRTSYSYTRIGRLEDVTGLNDALGGGSVSVRFEAVASNP